MEVGSREYAEFDQTYRRYRLTEDGISPITYPGLTDALVKLDSDEHDEEGKITEDREMRVRMVDKRRNKRVLFEKDAVLPTFYGDTQATSVVLCWGSPKLVVKEAAERIAGEGIPVAVLHFGQVYPLTPAMIVPHRLDEKRLICVENNAGAQFAHLLKSELNLVVNRSVLKYDGDCFTVAELYQTLKGLLS